MQKIYINMPSITFAMKSEKILRANHIYGLVVKTPSQFSSRGCSYSIVINSNQLEAAKIILDKSNIKVNDIRYEQEVQS